MPRAVQISHIAVEAGEWFRFSNDYPSVEGKFSSEG